MKTKILLVISLVFLLVFTSCNKDKDIPNSIKFSTTKVLPLINVEINGVKGKLLVDTGANISMIDYHAAEKYGFNVIDMEDMEVTGVGGVRKVYHTRGIETYYNGDPMYVRFKSADMKNIRLQLGIVGIIGSDYLLQHNMVIDYKNKVLRKSNILD